MDLTQCSAQELLALYRSGAASPTEATRAVLKRIAQLNPSLLAYCLVDETQALASARASEAKWQSHRHQGTPVGALESALSHRLGDRRWIARLITAAVSREATA